MNNIRNIKVNRIIQKLGKLYPDVEKIFNNWSDPAVAGNGTSILNAVTNYTTALLHVGLVTSDEYSEIITYFNSLIMLDDRYNGYSSAGKVPLYRLIYKYFYNKDLYDKYPGCNVAKKLMLDAEKSIKEIIGL